MDIVDTGTIKLSEENPETFGFWVDLNRYQFQEGQGTWVQAMPLGTYSHPIHGKIDITPERVQRFAQNVVANVRGQDLDIDYDHKERTGEAAGWVKGARAVLDDPDPSRRGLWLLVDWTSDALQKVKAKAYRYFSPEFVDAWAHPQTGQKHQDVLFGGALTNRPFLKGILPINLSELTGDDTQEPPKGNGGDMNREWLENLANRLGVAFDEKTSDEDLQSAIAAYEPPAPSSGGSGEGDPSKLSEDDELKKLAETNPVIARMLQEQEAARQRMEVLEAANKLAEVNSTVTRLNEFAGQHNYTITPNAQKLLSEALTKAHTKELSESIVKTFEGLMDGGLKELGERGGRPGGHQTSGNAVEEFEKVVKTLMEADKDLTYADAVEMASAENRQLFAEYRDASFAGRED